MTYADPAKRREARRAADRKRTGNKPWHPGGPGRPPIGERTKQGLCVKCGGKPKAGKLRCESCLAKQRTYDKAYRKGLKGGPMEPQCKLPDGKMRADHVFGPVDGLCACGARKMEFAPRPPLRPEIVRAATPRRASAATRPAAPPVVAPAKPAPAPKARAKRQPSPAKIEKRISDTTFRALVATLEERRELLDALISKLREVEEWWP